MAKRTIRDKKFILTDHAQRRFSARRINDEMFEMAILYGRKFYANSAEVYFVGKKEVERARKSGVDIRKIEGLNIIVQNVGNEKIVVTAFKNHSLKQYREQ